MIVRSELLDSAPMKTIRIVVLIGAAISLAISLLWSLLTRMPRAPRDRARKLLSAASWLGEASNDGELVKLKGIVRTSDPGDRLMAPISKIRCVALRIRAQPRRGLDPRSKLVEKIEHIRYERGRRAIHWRTTDRCAFSASLDHSVDDQRNR